MLSIVVPATDDPPTLTACLTAIDDAVARLRVADSAVDTEVIVVRSPAEASAAGARNIGVQRAVGETVVFVDADVTVHPDSLVRIHETFVQHPEIAAVFGSYDSEPADTSTISTFRNLLHHLVHHDNAGSIDTFWTGLGALRRAAFVEVGGFDEERFPHASVEDIDLGYRLTAAGLRIHLDPSIQGTHLKRWTLRSMIHTDFARRALPWIALQVRNRRVSTSLNLGWRHQLSAVAAVGVAAAVAVVAWHRPLGLAVLALSLLVIVAVNGTLYSLMARRLGPAAAAAGVGLHIVHHLVAVVAVPIGLAVALVPSKRSEPAVVAGALDAESAL